MISFVIPLYNEADNLTTLHTELADSVASAGMWPSDVLVFFWAVPAMMTLFLSPRDPDSGFRWLRLCDFVKPRAASTPRSSPPSPSQRSCWRRSVSTA